MRCVMPKPGKGAPDWKGSSNDRGGISRLLFQDTWENSRQAAKQPGVSNPLRSFQSVSNARPIQAQLLPSSRGVSHVPWASVDNPAMLWVWPQDAWSHGFVCTHGWGFWAHGYVCTHGWGFRSHRYVCTHGWVIGSRHYMCTHGWGFRAHRCVCAHGWASEQISMCAHMAGASGRPAPTALTSHSFPPLDQQRASARLWDRAFLYKLELSDKIQDAQWKLNFR